MSIDPDLNYSRMPPGRCKQVLFASDQGLCQSILLLLFIFMMPDPITVKHKSHNPKVMFLAAVAKRKSACHGDIFTKTEMSIFTIAQ
jgi:hypothetical protein